MSARASIDARAAASRCGHGIAPVRLESGCERRRARLREGERFNAANALEAGGDSVLDSADGNEKQRFDAGHDRHVGEQTAIAAGVTAGHGRVLRMLLRLLLRMYAAGVVRCLILYGWQRGDGIPPRHGSRRQYRAKSAFDSAFTAVARGERMRDRWRERGHQDRKQSQPTANLPMETAQDAPGDTM